jgi:hypothetical protein
MHESATTIAVYAVSLSGLTWMPTLFPARFDVTVCA